MKMQHIYVCVQGLFKNYLQKVPHENAMRRRSQTLLQGPEKKNLLQVQSGTNEDKVTPYGWEHNKSGSETEQHQTLVEVNHENIRLLLLVYIRKRNDNVLLKAFFRFDFKCPPTSNQNTLQNKTSTSWMEKNKDMVTTCWKIMCVCVCDKIHTHTLTHTHVHTHHQTNNYY